MKKQIQQHNNNKKKSHFNYHFRLME